MNRQLRLIALLAICLPLTGCYDCHPSAPPLTPRLYQKTFDEALASVSTLADARMFSRTASESTTTIAVSPMSVAVTGNQVLAALDDHTLVRLQADTSTLIAGKNSHVPYHGFEGGFADGSGADARFNGITAIRRLPGGDLVLADSFNHRIRRITADGHVTTLAGSGKAGFADGMKDQAEFNQPWGLAVADDGTIFVSDSLNHRIRCIAPDGLVTTLAGTGQWGRMDAEAIHATFNEPRGLARDDHGTIYVADAGNHAIRMIQPDGRVATLAGLSAGYHDGPRGSAKFSLPSAVALTPSGDILVADTLNHAIRKLSPRSGAVTTLTGGGNAKQVSERESDFSTWGNRDGKRNEALFQLPSDLMFDDEGSLLVADSGNQAIRKITFER